MTYKNIVRHFGLTFSASVAVSITLILISVFMLLTNNLNSFTKHIEQQVTIRASIDTIVKDKQKQQLLHAIEQLNTVKHVTLSTGKEELENYKAEFQDDSTMFDMYEGKANPIRDTFLIEVKNGKDIQKTADKIENMKVSIYTRKQEIAIMRFVGASNWAIKFPMMLEGVFIGILGSLVPVLLTIFGYQYVYTILGGTFMSNMFVLQTVFPMTLEISGILILIGVLVGLVGSFFSTTRYLHWKR